MQHAIFRDAKRYATCEIVPITQEGPSQGTGNWMRAPAHFGQIRMHVICDIALLTERAGKGLCTNPHETQ